MSQTGLPQCVLFDLGGGIVDVDMGGVVSSFSSNAIDTGDAESWYGAAAIDQFEKGEIGTADFADAIVRELGLDCSAEQFLGAYGNCHRGMFPGAADLLEDISGKTHLACFSNTTPLHWQTLCSELRIDHHFQTKILSFELGQRKPDSAAFNAAAECLPFTPEDVMFFDDRPENVDGAKTAGFDAHLVYGPEPAAEILGKY